MAQKSHIALCLTLFCFLFAVNSVYGESKIKSISAPTKALSSHKIVVRASSGTGGDGEYDYESDKSEDSEEDCPYNQFFHIRGQHCVPWKCPGGNKYRNVETGDCVISILNKNKNRILWGQPRGIWRHSRYGQVYPRHKINLVWKG